MRYFQNPNDGNRVYGYDSQDATQADLLQSAINGKWVEVTGNWPPAPTTAEVTATVRAKRDACIAAVPWRYERHARELRLGLTPTDDLAKLDAYVQALTNLPAKAGFPSSTAFDAYSLALFNLPQQPGFPNTTTLPVAP